jgi:pimeloyl-ACP methyl ester carboxylesterase
MPPSLPDALLKVSRPGVRLCVRRFGGAPDPPLILLHGFPDFWRGWAGLIGALAGEGQTLLVPDLRGYGDSEAGPGAAFDLVALADDVLAIADASGAQTFDLAGSDWGGVIAWACAQIAPRRVRRLMALNAPHPFVFAQTLQTDPDQQARSAYIAALQSPGAEASVAADEFAALEAAFASVVAAGRRDAAIQQAYREAWARPQRLEAMLAFYRSATFLQDSGSTWRPHAPLQSPTLLIWGDQDGAFVPTLPDAHRPIAARLTIRREPALGHWPHQEDPARIAALWRAWAAVID